MRNVVYMQPSPYTPGMTTVRVPGRDRQLEEIRERLAYTASFGRLNGRIRVDVGPRGIGKTSLLRAAEADARRLGYLSIWVTAGDGTLMNALADEIAEATASWREDLRSILRSALSGISVTVAGITVAPPAAPPTPRANARTFGDLVVLLTETAVKNGSTGVAIFIDEVQSGDREGLRALAYAWQHLQAEEPLLPATVFTAGLNNSQDVITDAASFAERYNYNHLENLDDDAAISAIVEPAAALGVTWTPDAVQSVLRAAAGYPYFVQLLGDFTWRAAQNPDPGQDITADHFSAGMAGFTQAQNNFFRARWTKATRAEAEFLAAMAQLGDEASRGEIANQIGKHTDALGMVRNSLINKGLIESSGYGGVRFTAPGFAEFIRNQIPGAHPGAATDRQRITPSTG